MALDMIDIPQDYSQWSTEYRLGWNAMHWAAAGGIVPVAEKLLKVAPTLINTRVKDDGEEATALHLAAESAKSKEMVKLLLSHGADAKATTHELRLTPLGSFLSNQRSELNHNILEVLLTASKPAKYLVFSSSGWNVLHYAVGRAVMLDAESLPGHVLLRDLHTFQEIRDLVESTTAEGWTPLHLACYFVGYAAVRILVDDYGADVQASTPNGARSFDIVLERARRYPDGLRGVDSMSRWTRSAYRSALFLREKLAAIEGSFELPKLHIAAYIGHFDEVVTLVGQDLNAVAETNYDGETAREMLQNTLPNAVPAEWASRFCEIAKRVTEFLENKELELEEERYFAQRNITTDNR